MSAMEDIKELRQRTGAGVLDCKKALQEKDGDVEAAVDYLREKGITEAAEKSGRVAAEGLVNVIIDDDHKNGLIVEVNSETDFVAKNDNFQELVEDISEHLMQSDKDRVEAVKQEKWYKDSSKNVNTIIKEAIANIGENINLRRFVRKQTDGFLQGYIHMNGKIGVLVEISGEETEENVEAAKNIAMHIAASSPDYIDREEISDEAVEKERNIYREQMMNEGKPEHILDQIVDGKMDKYYSQVCLLEQPFVRDTDIAVEEYLSDYEIEINDFVRYEIGEGIETEEEDFASEVQAEMNTDE